MDPNKLVGRKLKRMAKQIVVECYNRGVEFNVISKKQFKMIKDDKSYIIRNGSILSSVNPSLSKKVCDSKEITSRLLRSKGFNAPENAVFNKVDLERAWQWAQHILPVVLKPYNGKMGELVFVNIDNYRDFRDCYIKIVDSHDEVLVEQFVQGEEYRFTYINNEIVAVAKRVPANVVGDGTSTIEQLIKMKNIKKKNNPIHKSITFDQETNRVLGTQGYSLQSIPENGKIVFLRNNSNVSTGGDAIDVTDEINDEIKDYVRKAIRTINGLIICGADILIDKDNNITILELNPRPMLAMHVYPWQGQTRNVVEKFVDALFPNTKKDKDIEQSKFIIDDSKVENEKDVKKTNKKGLLLNFFISDRRKK